MTVPKTPSQRISRFFLKRMKIESFGFLTNKTIGPFSPKLTVVFGKNEAGKTTLNAFLSGVIFGWEEARGKKNTYKPENAERSGSLFFEDIEGAEEFEISRTKNTKGLKGEAALVDDIDKETFQTMFALTSDELRSLRKTTDVTAKLLTAGSGTSSSPAETLIALQKEIQGYTSKSTQVEHSLLNIEVQLEDLREAIDIASEEAQRFKKQDREFHEIIPQKERLLTKLEQLNKEIENLTAGKASLEKIENQLEQSTQQQAELTQELQILESGLNTEDEQTGVAHLDSMQENVLRDQISRLMQERSKYENRVASAEDTHVTSRARYEALLESEDLQEKERRLKSQKRVQVVLSIVFPVLFIGVGVPVFMYGRTVDSLSFTTLGIGLVVFALIMAGGALVMLFRPNKSEEEFARLKEDAQWVLLQDKKKLEACEKELFLLDESIVQFLTDEGLGAAQGSLHQALSILDEVNSLRSKKGLHEQRLQALSAQMASTKEAFKQVKMQKMELFEQLKLDQEATVFTIEALIERKTQQRSGLMESSGALNQRYGELEQELAQAKSLRDLDTYKLLYQEALTRQQESVQDYTRLLLAKRMLETAIGAWESKSQPEVYAQASRLFEKMTAGAWVQVRMSEKGALQVVDAVKTIRDPLHLSLGTCQQLYLSLRIALLMTAENVGKALPIMADDILVNFDEERRKGAVEALIELAEKRQVIVFTCHKEIVSLMCETSSQINLVEL